jgi:hypothetical protein
VKWVAWCCLDAPAIALEGATTANIAAATIASAANENPLICRIPASFAQQSKTDAFEHGDAAQLHVEPTKAITRSITGL